jgi:ribonuclease P/MRP protein subunit POP3
VLSSQDEADIVDLLCWLLEPIGRHRKEHLKPSRGSSSRKRKRKAAQHATSSTDAMPAPPNPAISSHITLGFNTTIRYLESLSAISTPQPLGGPTLEQSKSIGLLAPLSAVFVCCAGLPPILTSSLPLLTATASLAFPDEPPTRLIPLGKIAGDRLAQALHQPTVGFVGLRSDTAAAKNLMDLVRDRVQPVDVPWLKEAGSATYLPVKITRTEVQVGPKKKVTQSLRDDGDQKGSAMQTTCIAINT